MPYREAAACVITRIEELIVYADSTLRRNIRNELKIHEREDYADIIGDNRGGGTYVVTLRALGPSRSAAQIFVSDNMISPKVIADNISSAVARCGGR